MSESRTDTLQNDIVAFDNCMEVVADTSVQELTIDVDRVQPTSPVVPESCPADDNRVDDGADQHKTIWHRLYQVLSSSIGLVVLLVIYTLIGAGVLCYTEYDRELQMHAELDAVRRRVIDDIVNVTTSKSREGRVKARDLSDVSLADAVEALMEEYSDVRLSLNPSLQPPRWTFAGAMYFCGTVYTTIGEFQWA